MERFRCSDVICALLRKVSFYECHVIKKLILNEIEIRDETTTTRKILMVKNFGSITLET